MCPLPHPCTLCMATTSPNIMLNQITITKLDGNLSYREPHQLSNHSAAVVKKLIYFLHRCRPVSRSEESTAYVAEHVSKTGIGTRHDSIRSFLRHLPAILLAAVVHSDTLPFLTRWVFAPKTLGRFPPVRTNRSIFPVFTCCGCACRSLAQPGEHPISN